MGAPDLKSLLHVGYDILTTAISAKTRRILAQLGDVHHETTDTDNAEWVQTVGLATRPPKPLKGKTSAQAIVVKCGDRDVVIGSWDLRGLELYGALDHGESALYAAGEDGNAQGRILLKKTGAVAIYTTKGNTADGTSVTIQALPSGEIHIASEFGGISIKSDGITILSGSGAGIKLSADGVNIAGATNVINGAVVLGDATATGVATQASQTALMTALAAFCTSIAAATPAVGATAATLGAAAVAPTNYSTSVKASA